MLWVIQKNLWHEPEYRNFVAMMERIDIPHQIVTVVPFSHEIQPQPPEGRKVAYGSTTLMRITQEQGWDPGCYYNENFDFRGWLKGWGTNLLNHDSTVCAFKDVQTDLDHVFIRPCEDLKQFTGTVIAREELEDWKDRTLKMDSMSTLTGDTCVAFAPPKSIYKEYRFFVVDYQICTYSTYKVKERLDTSHPVDEDAIAFAMKMVELWCPHKVFVIDVAMTPEGFKIIEANCANSAGFYNCDVSKLVQTIHRTETR